MCWPYYDLRKPAKDHATLARCRRRVRWQGAEIPEAEYCGEACVTDAEEAMLAEITGNADLQPQD